MVCECMVSTERPNFSAIGLQFLFTFLQSQKHFLSEIYILLPHVCLLTCDLSQKHLMKFCYPKHAIGFWKNV